jgi:hypothetical protein
MAAKKPATAKGTRRQAGRSAVEAGGSRKLVAFDPETLQAVELLGRDSMKDFQELADEAFRDLLKKHGRPTSLKEALRQSTRTLPANDQALKRAPRGR